LSRSSEELEREDRVRTLRGDIELLGQLEMLPQWQWYRKLIDGEIARAHTAMENAKDAADVFRAQGRVKGLRVALAAVASARLEIVEELRSHGEEVR
jgi:hypothetical protein